MTATAQAPVNGATQAAQFPNAEKLLGKVGAQIEARVGLARHPEMPAEFQDRWRLAEIFAASGIVPEGYREKDGTIRPERVFVALQYAAELGLSPMYGVQNIAVVNGRPSLMFQAKLGLVASTGLLEDHWPEYSADGELCRYYVKRFGFERVVVGEFTLAIAKAAELTKKSTWRAYSRDMLCARAGSRALNEAFPDILAGLADPDEAEEIAEREQKDRAQAKAALFVLLPEQVAALKRLIAAKKIPGDDLKAIAQTVTGGRAVSTGANGVPDYSRSEWEAYEAAVRAWAPKTAPAGPVAQTAPAAAPVSRLADVAKAYNADQARMAHAAKTAGVDLSKATDADIEAIENALTAMDAADDEAARANG